MIEQRLQAHAIDRHANLVAQGLQRGPPATCNRRAKRVVSQQRRLIGFAARLRVTERPIDENTEPHFGAFVEMVQVGHALRENWLRSA